MIVDDSAVVRGLVSKWIEEEPGLQVVARHANGQRAVDDVAASAPDVIVLDVEMPVMDGLAALPLLLRSLPGVKVVMASTLTRRNAEVSLKALSLGATDYIPKPDSNSGITTSDGFRRDLIQKLRGLGRLRSHLAAPARPAVAGRAAAGPAAPVRAASAGAHGISLRPFSSVPPRVLVIGSSTGGPQALVKLVGDIAPAISNIPVLITQHMPATFTTILAKHLGEASGRPCKEGENNEAVAAGAIYVAPGGYHMRLSAQSGKTVITLDRGPEINFCRPAVDPLFETASSIYRSGVLAVVLTGMGSDGANGARAIAAAGGSVIAQDEATSVVWGMPGAAAQAGACSAVLPLGEIGAKVRTLVK
jgi:two-component system chemotaxis response regulator CheB